MHDVDGVNAGYARLLLDEYLENPEAVLPEWRALFESGDAEIVTSLPGLARLLETLPRNGGSANGGAATARHRRRRPRAPTRELLGGVAAAMALVKALPHARPSRGAARPARLGAGRRPGARPDAARAAADARAAGAHPRLGAAHRTSPARRSPRRCRGCRRPTAARSPTRSSTSRRTSSACGCARRSSRGATASRSTADEQRRLYTRLCQVEAMERYLRRSFLGQKQFSLEGLDVLIPMLDESLELAAAAGHRAGRARHGAPRAAQRARAHDRPAVRVDPARVRGRALDRGRRRRRRGRHRRRQVPPRRARRLRRPPPARSASPSPRTRATSRRSTRWSRAGRAPSRPTAPAATACTTRPCAMPILLHGDAAFAGQGVVAETLNYYALEGYWTGGTLHVITNNQVGFTTDPEQGRSTRYSSDLAKGFDVPIVHVNADDPEAAISAVRLALAYRRRFGHDVVIDLVGYRRFGHNEQDEAAYTQPLMVEQIARHPTVRELYAAKLVEDGVLGAEEAESLAAEALGEAARGARAAQGVVRPGRAAEVARRGRAARDRRRRSTRASRPTCCASSTRSCCACPTGSRSTRSSRASSSGAARRSTTGEIDWGQAESLAFASLLVDGVPIRLTGQDTERGTFSHRHLVLHDAHERRARDADPGARRGRPRRSRSTTRRCPSSRASASSTATRPRRPRRSCSGRRSSATSRNGAQTIIDQFIVERPRQVEADLTPDAAAPARVRGQRPRAFERAARALPPARRAGEHPHRELHDRGAVLPPAAAAGARPERAAARRDDAEGPAAAEGRGARRSTSSPTGASSS